MELLYLDESGSTGLNLDVKTQPIFILAGVQVKDTDWRTINDKFEEEKIKIYPDFKNIEIHANELFNSNKKSPFYKNDWKFNFEILEKLVDLISSLDLQILSTIVIKKYYQKHFGNNIIVDPYLYSFAVLYEKFNKNLVKNNECGIIFCDELKSMEDSLKILYPNLRKDNKNIIEKTFYLDSKTNNFIQIADVCAFYLNKYCTICKNLSTMDSFKKEHCIKMCKKLAKLFGGKIQALDLDNYDWYFE